MLMVDMSLSYSWVDVATHSIACHLAFFKSVVAMLHAAATS